jgi:LPXTG-motif cell wall-anchored protein
MGVSGSGIPRVPEIRSGYVEADLHGKKGTMMWAKRLIIGSGLAVASLLMVPNVAGAADVGCYTNCAPPVVAPTSDGTSPSSALPYGSTPGAANPSSATGTSSLPFTGADVEELAVVGVGAVLAGGLLLRRRRSVA